MDESVPDVEIYIEGFRVVRKDRNRNGGGVVIYIRYYLNFKVLENRSLNDIEALLLLVVTNHAKLFICMSWYRPPNSPVGIFGYYEESLICPDSLHYNIIIMGDLIIVT